MDHPTDTIPSGGTDGGQGPDLRAHLERPAVRWALISGGAIVLLHVVAAVVLFGLQRSHTDAVLAGVEVDSEPVGGLSREHLVEVVAARGEERLAQPVRITTTTQGDDAGAAAFDLAAVDTAAVGDPIGELETDRAQIGVTVDVHQTADDAWAQGRRGIWRALADQIRVRVGSTLSVPLHLDVLDQDLQAWSHEAAEELATDPRPAAIEFVVVDDADEAEAEVEVTTSRIGVDVTPGTVADRVRDRVVQVGPLHVEVPVQTLQPAVTDADVDAVIDEAQLVVSGPVELEHPAPADDLVLHPADLAAVLVVDADPDAQEGERLTITTSPDRLEDHLGDERVDELGPAAVEASIELDDGEAVIEGGTDGFDLDLEATATLVVELATRSEPRTGELPGDITEPDIAREDAEAALPAAEVLVSADVVLSNPSDAADLELSPADLSEVLEVEFGPAVVEGDDEGDPIEVTTSGEALADHLGDDGVDELEMSPVDAEVSEDGGELIIEGGSPGFGVDLDATAEVVAELASQEDDRSAELPGDVTESERSPGGLEDAGITEIVSSFTTDLVPGQPRNTNIQLAADHLDGDIIQPGETYSLNQGIGQRTADRGFVENGFIEDGEVISVTGGGVSQMGTTFVNAAWFAGIAIHEFTPHSLYFQRYPMGREATLSWGTLDVVVENDSPYAIMILGSHTDSSVTISFASTDWAEVDTWTGEPTDVVPGDVRDGFTIEFGRDITYPDGSTTSETYAHTYQPED